MANLLHFFMAAEDELAFFRFLERFELEVYPRRIPQGFVSFRASGARFADVPAEECYLAATAIGAVQVDRVKRGPDKGAWLVDEVRSPVIYLERSRFNEDGELQSGKLWAELDVTPQKGRRDAAPDRFRKLYGEVEAQLKKTYRKSEPMGFWVGPAAARAFKDGLVLRDAQHRGGTVRPFR